jgi:hypothetical protein
MRARVDDPRLPSRAEIEARMREDEAWGWRDREGGDHAPRP